MYKNAFAKKEKNSCYFDLYFWNDLMNNFLPFFSAKLFIHGVIFLIKNAGNLTHFF
jgi:hypothetical protein